MVEASALLEELGDGVRLLGVDLLLDDQVRAVAVDLAGEGGVERALGGGVLVATTLATSVVQRLPLYALTRSLGASRKQLAAVVLLEAAAIGLFGGLLGVAAGAVGARFAEGSVRQTVSAVLRGVPSSGVDVGPGLIVAGLALAVITALAAALLPLAEALTAPPMQGLRAVPLRRLLARERRRTLAVIGLMVVVAAALTRLPALWGLPIPALLAALLVMASLLVGSSFSLMCSSTCSLSAGA